MAVDLLESVAIEYRDLLSRSVAEGAKERGICGLIQWAQ